jgi:tape measure domain-containing protein
MAKAIDTLSIKLDFKDAGTQRIVDKIKGSFKGLQQVISGDTQPAMRKLRSEINTLASAGNKSISTIDAQVTALRALRREADINSKEFKQLTADIGKYEKQLNKAQGRRGGGSRGGRALAATQIGGAAISGGIFGGPEGFVGALGGAALGGVPGSFAGAAIGAQIGGIRKSLGGVAETVAEINAMKIALAGVSTGAEDYKKSIDSVMSISKEFLFPVDKAIGEFTRLKAAVVGAGFGTKETTDVFKGFAAAILATGGNSEKLSGALLAASQVFSKGKVQAEELRGQIGERLPGAFTTFAQSIGVGSKELDEMLRKGEVSTENFVEFTRTLFARYEKTAETLGSSPEKAGQRLQLALSLATIEYGGFFQKVGAGFQDYITGLVTFATKNKKTFKKVIANVIVFVQDFKTAIKGLVALVKEAFGGLFVFLGQAIKVFVEQVVAPFFNVINAAIEGLSKRVKLGQAERKLGGPFGRAGEIREEELEAYKKEKGIVKSARTGTSIADNDEIERRSQIRILQEAGMAPKSRDDMFAEAMKGLDKAFAVFDPSSGFGTSLGKKTGDPSTEDGGTGGGTDKTQDRIGRADEIVRRLQDQLRIQESQGRIGQVIAKQAKERSDLEARFQALLKAGANDEITRAQTEAKKLLAKKQSLELEKRTKEVIEKATKPLEDITKNIHEKIRADKEYARLIEEGVNPALAKQFIEIDKQFNASKDLLDVMIKEAEASLSKLQSEEGTTEAIQAQIKALEDLKRAREELPEKAGEAKEAAEDDPFSKTESEFDQFKDKFEKGLKDMINIGPKLADVALGAINSVTDGLIEMITTGKANFKEMAAAILKDIAKIILRATIAKAVAAAFGLNLNASAKGNVIEGGSIKPYAKGGVVAGPTMFPMAGNNIGLMGEAGPEAIMPLKRGPNGRLGVEVANQNSPREAMSRYSRSSRGSGVIPSDGGSSASGDGGVAVAAPIDVRYTVERINSVDYVTADQFQSGMQSAAAQGAQRGEQNTLKRLQMSGGTRKRLGL